MAYMISFLHTNYQKHKTALRYVISGAVSAVVNIASLSVFVAYAHLNYIFAEGIAFTLSFVVNFTLQRTWTFDDTQHTKIKDQAFWYLALSLANFIGNICLLYFFVHEVHVWYPIAEAVSIILLALISFFSCRHYIFAASENRIRTQTILKTHAPLIVVSAAFLFTLFLSTYKLTESPPLYFDEGIIVQTAMNEARYGLHAEMQVAPGTFVSAAYTSTTSYPLTFVIAAAFHFFGTSLLVARSVMVLFILGLTLGLWVLISKRGASLYAAVGLWLVITFPPLYGNGKDVLGEIPGLLYLTLFLLLVDRIEHKKTGILDFFAAGILLGLVVATKPIFILLLAPVGIVFLCSQSLLSISKTVAGLFGCIIAMGVWVAVQFSNQTISQILAFYANPYGTNIPSSIAQNAKLFIHQPEALYALLLLLVWVASFGVRLYKKEIISRTEYIAGGFAVLVYLAFLRANGDYRYFFLGEIFALLYFPFAISRLLELLPRSVPRFLVWAVCGILVVFQVYECFDHSWVAEHYNSHKTAVVTAAMRTLPASASIFIYQAPELPLFLPHDMPYYQYFTATQTISIGEEEIPLIAQGVPDFVLMPQNLAPSVVVPNLTRYHLMKKFDSYSLWQKT